MFKFKNMLDFTGIEIKLASPEEILSWSKATREKFIKQAMMHANKFTWDKTAKATVNIYQEVLKK